MFDSEDYFRRNKWGSLYIPPYRDLRQEPKPKPKRANVFAEIAVGVAACVCIVVIVLGL